jgi:hypothetical protein
MPLFWGGRGRGARSNTTLKSEIISLAQDSIQGPKVACSKTQLDYHHNYYFGIFAITEKEKSKVPKPPEN